MIMEVMMPIVMMKVIMVMMMKIIMMVMMMVRTMTMSLALPTVATTPQPFFPSQFYLPLRLR